MRTIEQIPTNNELDIEWYTFHSFCCNRYLPVYAGTRTIFVIYSVGKFRYYAGVQAANMYKCSNEDITTSKTDKNRLQNNCHSIKTNKVHNNLATITSNYSSFFISPRFHENRAIIKKSATYFEKRQLLHLVSIQLLHNVSFQYDICVRCFFQTFRALAKCYEATRSVSALY